MIEYNSPEYEILLEVFETTKLDKWIGRIVENYIYKYVEEKDDNCVKKYSTRFGILDGEYKIFVRGYLSYYYYYKDGKLNGEYKNWYYRDSICRHCNYKNDKLEGESKRWNARGGLVEHSFYKNDKLEGEYKSWYCDGQIREHFFYKDGKKEGECKTWHPNGKLEYYFSYKEGKKKYNLKR